ncbi:MAG: hypothetical protein AAF438_01565 [Pseudomonadota bacterium]
MNPVNLSRMLAVILFVTSFVSGCAAETTNPVEVYDQGDQVHHLVYVHNKQGERVLLRELVSDTDTITVLYLFGGGAMGVKNKTAGLWCTDSFEDSHILRTLYAKYKDKGVNFVAVAFPAVFHTQYMGYPQSVFLEEADNSDAFSNAVDAFVDSTYAAHEFGIIPIEPYYDLRFRLLSDRSDAYNQLELTPWDGAFRKTDESQTYGVPSFWILDSRGKILTKPFRGNIYHGLPETYSIAYTLQDVDEKMASLLSSM